MGVPRQEFPSGTMSDLGTWAAAAKSLTPSQCKFFSAGIVADIAAAIHSAPEQQNEMSSRYRLIGNVSQWQPRSWRCSAGKKK